MTESEWQECADPRLGLRWFLRGQASDRKLRLIAVAGCRQVWALLTDDRSRTAVEVAERFAEGEGTVTELEGALAAAGMVIGYDAEGYLVAYGPTIPPAFAARDAADERAFWAAKSAIDNLYAENAYPTPASVYHETPSGATERERVRRCLMAIVRDVFGNPFRPASLDPAWLTPTVTALAQAVYDQRIMPAGELDHDRLAVLSDALEEVGCDDAGILDHLRSTVPHVRGCWALDLILGKE